MPNVRMTPTAEFEAAALLANIGVTCIERGWLSSNNILVQGDGPPALVDSGYATHADQTLELVATALQDRQLELLLNTHLHSDHCGGNAALQAAYPELVTLIPPGQAAMVEDWDPVALTFEPTGQHCPRFAHQSVLLPGTTVQLGALSWEVHAAKGHDPHSIILFEPQHRVLISADALWENGFGIVFPELEGHSAFDEVANTLELIEKLGPAIVLPGHGALFTDVSASLSRARSRLDQFVQQPERHRRHALKVLIKFKLLEWQVISVPALFEWIMSTAYFKLAMPALASADRASARDWLDGMLCELERSRALTREGTTVFNA